MSDASTRKVQVRCLNCFQRFFPEVGDSVGTCPHCSMQWRLTWTGADFVKVRGPVWEQTRPASR